MTAEPQPRALAAAGLSGEAARLWDAVQEMYRGYLAGDPARTDAVLHPDITIWDSAELGMVRGLAELAALRERRPALPPGCGVVGLDATDPVIDVLGDVAVVRHLLHVRAGGDGDVQVIRNTGVWRRVGGAWLALHNHEDVWQ